MIGPELLNIIKVIFIWYYDNVSLYQIRYLVSMTALLITFRAHVYFDFFGITSAGARFGFKALASRDATASNATPAIPAPTLGLADTAFAIP